MTVRPAAGDADTNWPIVWTAFGAGAIAAAHLGKLPPALPEIRASLDAGLVTAGWIASIFFGDRLRPRPDRRRHRRPHRPAPGAGIRTPYAGTGQPGRQPCPVGPLNGLMVMGSNTGQLFGPPALAAARETAGSWEGTLWFLFALAGAGFVCALASRGFEKRREVRNQPHTDT